jgi:hypothetical protein
MFSIDKTYRPRPFLCEHCKAIIGIIIRDTKRIIRLNVFRQALRERNIDLLLNAPDDEMRGFSSAFYSMIGVNDGTILCYLCGAENQWAASKQAVLEMIDRLKKTGGLA